MTPILPSAAFLKRTLAFWQRTLRLQDWLIEIDFCKPTDIIDPFAQAETTFSSQSKEAHISIVHPRAGRVNTNIERTIVHELMHLHISTLLISKGITKASDDEESVISVLSDSFVRLREAATLG